VEEFMSNKEKSATGSSKLKMLLLYALVTILFGAFLGVGYFLVEGKPSDLAKGFAEGILGAIVITVVTGILLKKQTIIEKHHELKSEKSKEIFNKKVAVFQEVTDTIFSIIQDGKLEPEERIKVEGLLFKISLLSKTDTIKEFINFYTQNLANLNGAILKPNIKKDFLDLIYNLRNELELELNDPNDISFNEATNDYKNLIKSETEIKNAVMAQKIERPFNEIKKLSNDDTAAATVIEQIETIIQKLDKNEKWNGKLYKNLYYRDVRNLDRDDYQRFFGVQFWDDDYPAFTHEITISFNERNNKNENEIKYWHTILRERQDISQNEWDKLKVKLKEKYKDTKDTFAPYGRKEFDIQFNISDMNSWEQVTKCIEEKSTEVLQTFYDIIKQ